MTGETLLERNGPGWTTGRPTNREYGELVRLTYQNGASIMLPWRPDR